MKTEYKKVIVTKKDFEQRNGVVWCDLCEKPKKAGTIMHIFKTDTEYPNFIQLCHRHLQFISRRAL